jgi:hypothetical protein
MAQYNGPSLFYQKKPSRSPDRLPTNETNPARIESLRAYRRLTSVLLGKFALPMPNTEGKPK